MPRSAIMSGGADLVLTLAKIPQALLRYGRQTYVKAGPTDVRSPGHRSGSVRRHHRSLGREDPA